MNLDDYQNLLDRCGGAWQSLADRERWKLLHEWRKVYAVALHKKTGKWKYGQFEWHVFSFGHARALNGTKAVVAYEREQADCLIICPESTKLPAVQLQGGALPSFRAEMEDVYIWPEDLAWAMAFTHEESIGCGPYFCRREWCFISAGEL